MLGDLKRALRNAPALSALYERLSVLRLKLARTRRRCDLWLRPGPETAPVGKDAAKTLILEVGYGGLGDNLLHSHIPRIAKASGKWTTVLLSNLTPFRNGAHKQAVWGMNPYVDGFTNRPGVLYQDVAKNLPVDTNGMNFLDRIMLAYGLDDGLRFHEPEIHYKPRKLGEFADKVIYDPNWISPVKNEAMGPQIESYLHAHGVAIDMQFAPRQTSLPLAACKHLIHDRSFEEFCDIIHSCRDLYCFATGTAVLAAALGKKAHVFCHQGVASDFIFSRRHTYIHLDAPDVPGAMSPTSQHE